ncbi:MAG TPA: hypothetical protein PKU91_02480 [Phycisphaerales bacterium]|nr:hypothetical protein [Phycisphaerales bacterium]
MVSPQVLASVVSAGEGVPLPEGFAAVSIEAEGSAALIPLCVVVRTAPPAAGTIDDGPLIILSERLDARCYLGCMTDGSARVLRWIELWVQDTDGLIDVPPAYRDAMHNARIDDRWRRWCRMVEAAGRADGIVCAGWEHQHPAPILVDLADLRSIRPVEGASNGYWLLCENDSLLTERGLPAYGPTTHRYLYVPELGSETYFIPVTRGAPVNDRCLTPEEALGIGPTRVGLNLGAGMMMARVWQGVLLDQHIDELSGEKVVSSGGAGSTGALGMNGDRARVDRGLGLLVITVGRAGRLVETLHLKLRLLADAVASVRDAVADIGAPMLNVRSESFAVARPRESFGLPSEWAARVTLREPGVGVGIDLAGGEATLYMGPGGATSVYSPGVTGANVAGVGALRIRQVLADSDGAVIEARLVMQERAVLGPGDLVWLRVSVGGQRLDLYATPDFKKSTAATEIPLRTIKQPLSDSLRQKIKSAEGVNIPGTMFETLPMASTPHDLYSLAVLGVRILLCADRPLGTACSDFQDFARYIEDSAANEDDDKRTPLEERVRRVLDGRDPDGEKWRDAIGPQHLRREPWDAASALAVVTPGLWCGVLAALVRSIPGLGPDSTSKNYAEAPPKAPERVFDPLLADLRPLVVKSRSLVVSDTGSNAEIRSLILSKSKR